MISCATYDCLIILGAQPDLQTWEFPGQIRDCVRTAAGLMAAGKAGRAIASGKWSRRIEDLQLSQPFDECDKVAELPIGEGVDESLIGRERDSTDTISNLYYVKKRLLIPAGPKKVPFVVTDFRIPRFKYLVRKVFGPQYGAGYEPVPAGEATSPSCNETLTMAKGREILGSHEGR